MKTETQESKIPDGLHLGKNKYVTNGKVVRAIVKKISYYDKEKKLNQTIFRVIKYER